VTPGYFQALSIPVRAGRVFTESDVADRPRAAVVDEALARRTWPNESPIGRRIDVSVELFDRGYRVERVTAEVVGVVGTAAAGRPDATPPGTLYLAHAQQPLWNVAFVVSGDRPPQDVIATARQVLREMDAELPLYDARPMAEIVAATMASTRTVLSTLSVFASVAAVLAAVGLYAVIAYVVRQRRKEIAIRMALGARPRTVGLGVLRDGLILVTCGIGVGTLGSIATSALLSDLIIGVPVRDPVTLGAVAALLLIVSVLSTFVPAYRAASLDPVAGLRAD
jgi:putative ABC transport system permease protein